MRINHNIASLNTNRALARNNKSSSASLEKLSSGLRVNRAGDDAAGLAISEKMRGQIRGLGQAGSNANDGISLIQTAEGGLNETHAILHRMRELAIQSANDTNTKEDRQEIQKEIEQLTKEITRISTDTEFNTKKLLDGSMMANYDVAESNPGSLASELKIMSLESLDITKTYTGTLEVSNPGDSLINTADAPKIDTSGYAGTGLLDNGEYSIKVTAANALLGTATLSLFKGGAQVTPAVDMALANYLDNSANNQSPAELDGIVINAKLDTGDYAVGDIVGSFTIATASEKTATITWQDDGGNTLDPAIAENAFAYKTSDTAATGDTITISNIEDLALTFHVGANSQQNVQFGIPDCSAMSLGVDGLDLTSQTKADAAISVIDNAIEMISSVRGSLGAMQNRLEHTINNLGTSKENIAAAESQIRDVDMAEQMSMFTKDNILSQAATSMLAQANQQPQNILSLIQQ